MIFLGSPSLWLAFAFGLRHGLEADHVVVIDALTLQASTARERWAPWIGSFFALGHGFTVLLVSIVMLESSSAWMVSNAFLAVVSWLPILILTVLGFANLIGLLRAAPYRLMSWKQGLLPRRLRNSSKPWVIVAIGVIFALVIDSFVQGAVLASMAIVHGGLVEGIVLGLVFAGGMMVSETIDSHLVFRALGGSDEARILRRQRAIGIIIVALSFGTVILALIDKFGLRAKSGGFNATLGAFTILLVVAVWLFLRRVERSKSASSAESVP